MKKLAALLLAVALPALVPLFTACSSGGDDAPSSHTVDNGGVKHMDGFTNPLANCARCHGSNLRGGSGPSCYSCHNNSGHTASRGGQMHAVGLDCTRCHGPSNSGGLGPACSTCH